ncbi:umecyanin-like [Dioscorea cayenensis subsp. rotundata]|uniref:Umecyanin-like n=1 Tax=Dioscorea cayennensis subsp. rotundata TaxID=55577 RepID=A0AB40B813_DIOCR|nr:umecyanin-like [Dioscorea cayenensis subsp. rotundata]
MDKKVRRGGGIEESDGIYVSWGYSCVGDPAEFNFQTRSHDVVAVTKSGYDACSGNDQIASPVNNGPANIPLSSAGGYYYICSFSGHFYAGQKLTINVESLPSSSGNAPSPRLGAPPPPSS